jgi:hypothetical protein
MVIRSIIPVINMRFLMRVVFIELFLLSKLISGIGLGKKEKSNAGFSTLDDYILSL